MTVYIAKWLGKNPGSVPIFFPGDIIVFKNSNSAWVILTYDKALTPEGIIVSHFYQRTNCFRFTREL